MSRQGRNHSYQANNHHLKVMIDNTRMILSRGLSSTSTKEKKTFFNEKSAVITSSSPYITREKNTPYQLNKSADINYFIEKQKLGDQKNQENNKTNYYYIGQIQALEKKKFGRKNFYKRLRVDKEYKEQQQRYEKNSNDIELDQQKLTNVKQISSQIQVEELHYQMVLMQQKCKKNLYH